MPGMTPRRGRIGHPSELVRAGIEAVVDRARRGRIGQAIVTGYLRVPQRDEGLWSGADTATMISEEQW